MTKERDNPDAWIIGIVGASCLLGGGLIAHYVVPEIVKLINPPKPEPKPNPNPEPEKQPEPEPLRLRPKYMFSSAQVGEPIGNRQVPQRSYRHQMSQQQNVKKKTTWRVIS